MDEYERSAPELIHLLQTIDEPSFVYKHPREAEHLRSVRSVMQRVVRATYGYADDIRGAFGIPAATTPTIPESRDDCTVSLNKVLEYTVATLNGKWTMSEESIEKVAMPTPWGTTYTLEQILEHAIVHILRHRRQIERLLEN